MNSVILIGRLTRDPELRFLPGDGKGVCTFTIAVDRPYSTKETDFLKIVVWGRQAEHCANYLGKGRLVGVQGRIQTRTYEDNNGNKRYVTEIVAERVQFLEWKDKGQADTIEGFQDVDDEEIPF